MGAGWNTFGGFLTAGNVNGDGNGDILASDRAGQLWLYPSTGTGAFKGRTLAVASVWNAVSCLLGAGDLSGDGRADLMARDYGGNLYIHKSNGAGGFLADPIWAGAGWNGMLSVAGPGNFDRVGGNDVIARDSAGKLWLYPGDNAGRFGPRRLLGAGFSEYSIA